MDARSDPSNLIGQEQMFFSSIDSTENGRNFFPNSSSGISINQDDFLRQQDGSMEDCCDPHQYMPPTPSSPPLGFPQQVFNSAMTSPRQQLAAVSSSDGNCSRPYQHSAYDSQVSSSFPSMNQNMYNRAQLPTVPTSKQFTGDHDFEISFGPPTESAPKSATWTYSTKTGKLYTNIGSYCPFQFKTNSKPLVRPAYIRAVAMFKGSSNLHDIVKMCPNHAETNTEDPSVRNNFFVRSNNSNAVYLECPQTGRHSVIVPYSGPQAGTNYVTEMFAFKCFSSCASGHGRKPIEIIFTMEDSETARILGRCVVEIRVCACPGRDRRSDELNQEKAVLPNNGNKRAVKQKSYNRKKAKKSAPQEEYTITTPHKEVHDMLLNIKTVLESKFYAKSDADEEDESSASGHGKRAQSSIATTSHANENKSGYTSSCM